jgi:hypothetical protein
MVIDLAWDLNLEGDTRIQSTSGHYGIEPAHGVAIEITVKKIPNR